GLGNNEAGQIVGVYVNATGQHGFLLSDGFYTTLDDPLATGGTQAFGINDMGQIVGTYSNASGTHSFLYSGGVFTTIDDPVVNSHTLAHGINNNSQIARRPANRASLLQPKGARIDAAFAVLARAPPHGLFAMQFLRPTHSAHIPTSVV